MPNLPFRILFLLPVLFSPYFVFSQDGFHDEQYKEMKIAIDKPHKPCKTRFNLGWTFGFVNGDPHYTSNVSGGMGYTFGIMEEIPIQTKSTLLIGAEILKDGASFNSYFVAPGYSYLYIPSEEYYYHDLTMNEVHIPIEYKFFLTPMNLKGKSLYMTLGWAFRLITYENAAVTNSSNGNLVWEGQNDVSFVDHFLFSKGSGIVEASIGYQKFAKRNKKRGWFFALEYDYGVSWINYTGNGNGSNNIIFKLNTLSFKLGLTR